jgi:4-hydroxy-tetrahydrodipicolinate synthase
MTIRGIWAAVVTPLDRELAPDSAAAISYYRELLDRGCDGINVLGTTGEAMSFGIEQRLELMEAVASSGLPLERAMVGTGAASLVDAIRLTKAAFNLGFAAALVMPPFFFRGVSDDGVVDFFDALFERANPPRKRVLLYNFPRMSGVTFTRPLVGRLLAHFPDAFAGMKDSSNDAALQSELLAAYVDFAVLPGSESDLLVAKRRGVAGCISGSVALWPELAQAVFTGEDAEQERELTRRRSELDGLPFIPAVRRRIARDRGDDAWERIVPPQRSLSAEEVRLLEREAG